MSSEFFERVLGYIDEHICEKIELVELAEIAGYSPFYFSKLFSENMGISVTGYIRIRKLQYSMCSLLEGKKVLDVAVMYAFESHEGYTRSFTKLFGSTPSTVRKNLATYRVPEYAVPDTNKRRTIVDFDKNNLLENMHQIVFEVLRTSLEEAKEGFCTRIEIILLKDGRIKIQDNGRGISLSQDVQLNKSVLDKILAGHPISNVEYAKMGNFVQCSLQTVNSLCENLQINVYRDGMKYSQDYIRGIAQHEVVCVEHEHESGTEIILKSDSMIFGDCGFSEELIEDWVEENCELCRGVEIVIEKET